jgi:hypothetical protein
VFPIATQSGVSSYSYFPYGTTIPYNQTAQ